MIVLLATKWCGIDTARHRHSAVLVQCGRHTSSPPSAPSAHFTYIDLHVRDIHLVVTELLEGPGVDVIYRPFRMISQRGNPRDLWAYRRGFVSRCLYILCGYEKHLHEFESYSLP